MTEPSKSNVMAGLDEILAVPPGEQATESVNPMPAEERAEYMERLASVHRARRRGIGSEQLP